MFKNTTATVATVAPLALGIASGLSTTMDKAWYAKSTTTKFLHFFSL